jgi:hypothetical protein
MSSESVKVFVRARPRNAREIKENHPNCIRIHKHAMQIEIVKPGSTENIKPFTFDGVFGEDSEQSQVYEAAGYSLVNSVLDGYNGTIFAYGQTGCGKTWTMEGKADDEKQRGIIPNAFEHIFRHISAEKDSSKTYLVSAAYLEIYNEKVRDLVGEDCKKALELKEHKDSGVFVQGLSHNIVQNVAQLQKLMALGNSNRSVGSTLMNDQSSRSHSIFMVSIETTSTDNIHTAVIEENEEHIRAGTLNLVDLAGSERQSKTGAKGTQLKEANNINLSLSALGNVISALVAGKSKHIPYRDSKLTRLLQSSLGGNTKTTMIAALSPADDSYDETLSTLRYANRAKEIKNVPVVNQDPKDALLKEYQEQIKALKSMLSTQGMDASMALEGAMQATPARQRRGSDSGGGSPSKIGLIGADQLAKMREQYEEEKRSIALEKEETERRAKQVNDVRYCIYCFYIT